MGEGNRAYRDQSQPRDPCAHRACGRSCICPQPRHMATSPTATVSAVHRGVLPSYFVFILPQRLPHQVLLTLRRAVTVICLKNFKPGPSGGRKKVLLSLHPPAPTRVRVRTNSCQRKILKPGVKWSWEQNPGHPNPPQLRDPASSSSLCTLARFFFLLKDFFLFERHTERRKDRKRERNDPSTGSLIK